MQTNFSDDQLQKPNVADANLILGDCVHYGFCTAVCPTYVLLRDELDAPRGRIDLIREMLEADTPPSARTVGYIDRCLSCNSCMSTCAAKVDYMHLADIARAHIEENYRRPLFDRLFRRVLAETVPHVARFRSAVRLSQLLRPFAPLLSARLRTLLKLSSFPLPPAEDALAPGVYPAAGVRQHRVILLTGCVQQALAPRINHATLNLLTRHGCEVIVADEAACCGAFTLHMGMESRAKSSARNLIAAWTAILSRAETDASPIDAIIINASGCGTTVKDYGRIFAHDPDARDEAARIASLTRDLTEFLAGIELSVPARTVPFEVAYHDACSLQHAQKITAEPRTLLRGCGFVVHDVPEAHFCCGSAGAYNMLQPHIAEQLGERKAGHIENTGAAALVAGNLGCLTQLSLYTGLPAVHTAEMLDWATGGPCPEPLRGVSLPEPKAQTDIKTQADNGSDAGIW